jgi:hypothetical protein
LIRTREKATRSRILPAALGLWLLGTVAAPAQEPQTIPEANPCVDGLKKADGTPCDTLSEKLDETGGIITPPMGIDPGIGVPAPDPMPGTTPVIPPGAVPPDPDAGGTEGTIIVPK